MIKKVFVGMTIALVLFAGVFVFAKTSFAQDDSTETETEELVAPVMEAVENEYQYQNGENNDEADAIMTQTQTRTRDMELVENGECTDDCDDCDPIKEQLQLGSGVGNTGTAGAGPVGGAGTQQKGNLGVANGDGTGVPQGDGLKYGAGNQGNAQGFGTQGNGTGNPEDCPYYDTTTP